MASKEAVAKVVQKIFGTAPQLNIRTGNKYLKKPLIGAYLSRYYPEPIEKFARMTMPEYRSALEMRRAKKLDALRQRGKGPPKKGSGKKKK